MQLFEIYRNIFDRFDLLVLKPITINSNLTFTAVQYIFSHNNTQWCGIDNDLVLL